MEKLSILPAKIIIKKCSHSDYWYKDKIGKEFNIEDYSNRDYYVRIDGYLRAILKSDSEFINKKNPLI